MDDKLKEEQSNTKSNSIENDSIENNNNQHLQKELKHLKHSQGAYIGHITKTINKIDNFIVNEEHVDQVKYLEEQLDKYIKKLKIVVDEYCDISDSLEQNDVMNECYLEQNARVLKVKQTIESYICSQAVDPLKINPARKSYPKSVKSDLSENSRKSHSSKGSHKSSSSGKKSLSSKSSSSKSSVKSLSKEQAQLIRTQTEERVNRKLKLLEKRKQLEFEIAKEEVYEELLEAQNQVAIAELEEKKYLKAVKTENQDILDSKKMFEKSLKSNYLEDVPTVNPVIKTNSLQIPSTLLENCHLPANTIKTTAQIHKPPDSISQSSMKSSILEKTELDHNEKKKIEPVDRFIDLLIEGKETVLPKENNITLTIASAVQQEIESRHLPPVDLKTFNGDPSQWPEFIENFKTRVHTKPTFNDTMRMERLISVLRGEVKKEIESIGTNSMFYATALKTLKREYGNPLLVSHLKLKKLFDQPQIKGQDRLAIREYHHQLKCSNTWFLSMGYYDAICSTENLAKAVKRLPNYMRQKFYENTRDFDTTENVVTLIEFEKWLQIKISHLFNPIANIIASQESKQKDLPPHARCNNGKISPSEDTKLTCWLCKEKHKLHQCEKFKSKNLAEKKIIVEKERLCWNCLAKGHQIKDCKSNVKCRIANCGKRHHTLLHEIKPQQPPKDDVTTNNLNKSNIESKVYLQILPVKLTNGSKTITTNALLDCGADSTLIREDVAKQLNLHGSSKNLEIHNAFLKSRTVESKLVNFSISSKDHPENIQIKNAWVVPNLNIHRHSYNVNSLKETFTYLKDINLPNVEPTDVTLVIGADFPELVLHERYKSGNHGEPYAIKTKLGWVLMGGSKSNFKNTIESNNMSINFINPENYWSIENYGTLSKNDPIMMSKDEKRAMSILKSSTTMKNQRYEIPLLWKEDNPSLPNNRELALQRLYSLEKKLQKTPELEEKYSNVIKEYINKGYAIKLNEKEANETSDITNYIPHHCVLHPKKPNKVRVVFDASAKYKNDSLNSHLLKGPDLLNNLVSILIQFRLGRYAVTADIEQMFHQVKVKKSDQDALRFLWRFLKTEKPQEYAMTVHLFGKNDSPCSSNYALKKCARDQLQSENIIECIDNSFYMDDFVKSASSESLLLQVCQIIIKVLSSANFRLHKWITNSLLISKTLPQSEVSEKCINLNEHTIERVLGMLWKIKRDTLKVEFMHKSFPTTKRGVLSQLCSIFDPLGILNPCILELKLIVQELWRRKIEWDSIIPKDLLDRFTKFQNGFCYLEKVEIARYYGFDSSTESTELHIFADSSNQAYGAVAYIRDIKKGKINISFVLGKSRLAPLDKNALTIPKLELSAAVVAVRMKVKLLEESNISINKVYFWVDSKTVLRYIRNENKRFSVFVSHRINEIRNNSNIKDWHFIEGKLNVADDCTRVIKCKDFTSNSRYLKGPEFLREYCLDEILSKDEFRETSEAIKTNNNTSNLKQTDHQFISIIPWERYSSFYKLVKITSVVVNIAKYWKQKAKHKNSNYNTNLSVDNLHEASNLLLKHVQQEQYPNEYSNLLQGKQIKERKLIQLQPVLKNDLICVGGRIKHAQIPNESKHQVILPSNHRLTFLLLSYIHQKNHHCGREQLLALSREQYWVVHGKQLARKVIYNCLYCKRQRVKPQPQLMADLPPERLSFLQPPFSFTGVDYFGPVLVKRGYRTRSLSGYNKRYVCLFTCLTFRAIHLELCENMSTDDFIMTLRRFISRRGYPTKIMSDNGTNIVGANNELKRCLKELNQKRINNELLVHNIEWQFIPPGSPWMGGAWESLVKIAKRCLKTVTNGHPVYDQQLHTILVEIEGTINSRPLTSVSNDINDFQALTPNNFLIGRPSLNHSPGIFTEKQLNSKKKWKVTQALLEIFWKRFMKEYIPSLTVRHKWNKTNRNFKINDLVLIQTENTSRAFWPLARVIETYQSDDGHVRSVKLKLPNSTLIRPSNKLCLLEECD